MLDEQRPCWWKRFCCNLGLPVGALLVLTTLQTFLATDETIAFWKLGIYVSMFVMVTFLLYRAKFERMQVRRAVMRKLFEQRHGNVDETDIVGTATPDAYLQLHSHDVRMAHATCSCFPKDVVYNRIQEDGDDEGSRLLMKQAPHRDLCSCIWSTIQWLCCGGCGGGWLQCCGMCAIGQEDREIQQLLEPRQLQVDYITFQPYADYYPCILELRNSQIDSLVQHWRALSLLSFNLVKILSVCMTALAVVALLQLDPKFQIENLIVVVATFGQAFLILWFVHWQWHRFDLSMDALVKYFASGFCLCTFLSMMYEILLSTIFGFFSYLIVIIGVSQGDATTPEQVEKAAADFAEEHVGIFAVFVFLNAFVVAAMVEELSKYFGYYMVETPDLMDPKELILEENATEPPPSKDKSLVSQGAGITVAMVAVAAGFACSENLLYVFVYTPPGLTNEIATLVARSMFPIHPLCAAIQSVGIVRRDLEQDPKWQLGRSILPAVLLHGAFDFVLMLLALLESSSKNKDDAAPTTDDATLEEFDGGDAVPMLISVSMVIVGILYFCCEGAGQRRRLEEMDEVNASSGTDQHLV